VPQNGEFMVVFKQVEGLVSPAAFLLPSICNAGRPDTAPHRRDYIVFKSAMMSRPAKTPQDWEARRERVSSAAYEARWMGDSLVSVQHHVNTRAPFYNLQILLRGTQSSSNSMK